jgi:hypothetical protein
VLGPGDSFRTDRLVQRCGVPLCFLVICVLAHRPGCWIPGFARVSACPWWWEGPQATWGVCGLRAWLVVGAAVASRRWARRGSSRTVCREGDSVGARGLVPHRPSCSTVRGCVPGGSVWPVTVYNPENLLGQEDHGKRGGRRGRRAPRRPDALKPSVGESDGLRASLVRPMRSVASRRVARRGTSRTVFREGDEVRPGGHGPHRPTRITALAPEVFPERGVWSLTALGAKSSAGGGLLPGLTIGGEP